MQRLRSRISMITCYNINFVRMIQRLRFFLSSERYLSDRPWVRVACYSWIWSKDSSNELVIKFLSNFKIVRAVRFAEIDPFSTDNDNHRMVLTMPEDLDRCNKRFEDLFHECTTTLFSFIRKETTAERIFHRKLLEIPGPNHSILYNDFYYQR